MDRRRTTPPTASEVQSQSADDALGGAHNQELVVHRLIRRRVAEEVADRDEHLPFRRAEIHERQRLPYLDVEACVERATGSGSAGGWSREAVAHAVENH